MSETPEHYGPYFERDLRGTVHAVRCSCGWRAIGNGGASAFGMAWGNHAVESGEE